MPSILSLAGGASDGLETVLERMLKQQQVDQQNKQIQEQSRHNMASEGIQEHQLKSLDDDRRAREAEAARTHREAGEDRDNTNVARVIGLRPIGSFASPEEKTYETAHKAPEGLYGDYQPPSMGKSTEQGEEGATPGGFPWKGTEDQQIRLKNAHAATTPSHQVKTVLYQGKAVDADYDPKSDKTFYRGKDITNEAEHYEKPPAPDRTLVVTDEGFRPRGDVTKDVRGGKQVNPQDPAQIRNRRDMATAVGSHFDDAEQLINEADKRGLLGPLSGRTFTDFLAGKVGSTGNAADDELLGDLRTSLSMIRTGTASLHGRSGANVGIAKDLEKKMDEGYMDPAQLKGSLKALRKWVDTYAKKPGQQGQQGDGGGLPSVGGTFQGGKVLSVTPYKE